MNVWKLKAFDTGTNEWRTFHIGGEEDFAEMLGTLLRWRAEGQQVRIEWSEQN